MDATVNRVAAFFTFFTLRWASNEAGKRLMKWTVWELLKTKAIDFGKKIVKNFESALLLGLCLRIVIGYFDLWTTIEGISRCVQSYMQSV